MVRLTALKVIKKYAVENSITFSINIEARNRKMTTGYHHRHAKQSDLPYCATNQVSIGIHTPLLIRYHMQKRQR